MEKKKKFNAKEFLKAKTLSPLEQNKIRGGFGDPSLDDTVVVQQVQQVRVQVVRVVVVG